MKIAIVDDEPKQAELIRGFVMRYAAEHGWEADVRVFSGALDLVSDYAGEFDLVFMDIDMPMMNGLAASGMIRESDGRVQIVFVTNLACHAIDGYKVGALDFLVKPVGYGDVAFEIAKAERRMELAPDYIWLHTTDGIKKLPSGEIVCLQTEGHNIVVSVRGGGQLRVRAALKSFEDRLCGRGFIRCDHCALVNMRYIAAVSGSEILLEGGGKLFISRRRKKEFMNGFMDYIAQGGVSAAGAGS